MNSTNSVEQKLRNLQIHLSQGRNNDQLAEQGIYFARPTVLPSSNVFSSNVDRIPRTFDSSRKRESNLHSSRSYHDEYLPYDYHHQSNYSYLPSRMCQSSNDENLPQWRNSLPFSSQDEKSNENSTKTDFVNFRKKQFETGHVENLLHSSDQQTKKKFVSEKSKYENEWNRLTASTAVETVMERAAHFEEIDPEKFLKFKAKTNSSSQEILSDDDEEENLYSYQHYFKPIQNTSHPGTGSNTYPYPKG